MVLRVGVQIPPQHADYPAMRDAWKRAESLGADTLFTWDHFFPIAGDVNGRNFECWTLLAAMAEVTDRVEIGALLSCHSYRNPHLLADMARTVDHISNGRVLLGIGAGWYERDYAEYGFEFRTPRERVEDLEGNLAVVTARLKRLNPPPVRNSIPILIGLEGEKIGLRIVAEYADMWNGWSEPKILTKKNAILDDWCRRVGRNPTEIERSVLISEIGKVKHADAYAAAGMTHLIWSAAPPDYDLKPLADLVAWRDRRS